MMNHKLKALGLALVAVFAMSAVGASGASAAGELFHSEVPHAILDAHGGTQTFKITTGVAGVKELRCSTVTADATIAEGVSTVSSITATDVTYTGCEDVTDGFPLDVQMRTCDYLFTSERVGTHAPVHIQCSTPGDEIRINVTILGAQLPCTRVPAQTPTTGGVTYTNTGTTTTREVDINATVEGIEYTEIKETVCNGGSTDVVRNDAIYQGNIKVAGTNTAGQHVGVWWD